MLITKVTRSSLTSIVNRPLTKRFYAAAANSEVSLLSEERERGLNIFQIKSLSKRPLYMIST